MDEKTAPPRAPKKQKGNHWLLWWKIEPEELQKNIVEYDTLRIYQSARGISLLLLLLAVILNIIGICVGQQNAWALVDAIVAFGLGVFIYRGHRWAMLLAMVFWTLDKAFNIYRLANMPELHGSGYFVVANLIWWAVYMHAFYLAFIVEKEHIRAAAA